MGGCFRHVRQLHGVRVNCSSALRSSWRYWTPARKTKCATAHLLIERVQCSLQTRHAVAAASIAAHASDLMSRGFCKRARKLDIIYTTVREQFTIFKK
jgi:hypothetical protein